MSIFTNKLTAKQTQGLLVSLALDKDEGATFASTWLGFAAYRSATGWWLAVENTRPSAKPEERDLGCIASDRNPTEMRIFKTLDAAVQWVERNAQAVGLHWPHFRVVA